MRKHNTFIRQLGGANNTGFGKIYNAHAMLSAFLPPTGWHVPTAADWVTLQTNIEPQGIILGTGVGGLLKEVGIAHWNYHPDGGAIDYYRFKAMGNGGRSSGTGDYYGLRTISHWWSKSLFSPYTDRYRTYYLKYDDSLFGTTSVAAVINNGFSIRLIKDNSTNPGTVSDYEGHEYDCISIGQQVWTAKDWNSAYDRTGTPITLVPDNNDWLFAAYPACCYFNNDSSYQ